MTEYVYQSHFDQLMKRLWSAHFIPFLMYFCRFNFIDTPEIRVEGVGTILHELKSAENVIDKFREMFDKLMGENNAQSMLLCYLSPIGAVQMSNCLIALLLIYPENNLLR